MATIEGTGLGTPLTNAGAPVAGTDEVQTLTATGSAAGGTFRLGFQGSTTTALIFNAGIGAIDAALEALPTIGIGGVVCAGGPLGVAPVTVTFSGPQVAKRAVPNLVLAENLLTGGTNPTVAVAETTPGVDATGLGAPKGALLIDTNAGTLYQNTGTAAAPTWTTR
jgi:hypothetical protein